MNPHADTFFDRLEGVVREIEAHPEFEIVEYRLNPPLAGPARQSVEAAIGAPLDAVLSTFYERSNGAYLHWRVREDVDPDRLDVLREASEDYWIELPENDENPFARINILPLEQSVVHVDWIEEFAFPADASRSITIAGSQYREDELAAQLKPFDLFTDFNCMAFLFREAGLPSVLWLTNQYQDWSHSRLGDFPSYLDFLIDSRGITEAREDAYSTASGPGGAKASRTPGLFRIP